MGISSKLVPIFKISLQLLAGSEEKSYLCRR